MNRVFTDELLTEGIASRTMFIHETKNRFSTLLIPRFEPEQLRAKLDLLTRIKQLALPSLYGQVTMTQEAEEYLTAWWKDEDSGKSRANRSIKLAPYYARKQLHVLKLAMAMHFSDNDTMEIGIETFKRAIYELAQIEATMHLAITLDNKNPQSSLARKMARYLVRYGPQTKIELVAEFFGEIETGIPGIESTLEYLISTRQIEFKKIGSIMKYAALINENDYIPEGAIEARML